MNAKEAHQIANTSDARIKRENAEKAAKAKISRIKNEKAARKKFLTDFMESAESSIKWAAEQGEKSTRIGGGDGSMYSPSLYAPVPAQEQFDHHKNLKEIKTAMRLLRKQGYKVTQDIGSNTYSTQHESSVPDYDYTLYHWYLEISW